MTSRNPTDEPEPGDVAKRLKLDGSWVSAGVRLSNDARIAVLAHQEDIVVSEDALQEAVDGYRHRRGLHTRETTLDWLEASQLTLEDLTDFCRLRIQRDALLAAIPTTRIRGWFEEHRSDYDAALLSVLSYAAEAEAWLARTAVAESAAAFDDLVWGATTGGPIPARGRTVGLAVSAADGQRHRR